MIRSHQIEVEVIFVDVNERIAIPVNEGIFSISQFKSERKLNKLHRGCYILYPNGDIRKIANIKVTGFHGKGLWSKFFSILNSTHSISISLGETDIGISEFKKLIIECIQNDSSKPEPYLPQSKNLNELAKEIGEAKSFVDIYNLLEIPEPGDCLDVL